MLVLPSYTHTYKPEVSTYTQPTTSDAYRVHPIGGPDQVTPIYAVETPVYLT